MKNLWAVTFAVALISCNGQIPQICGPGQKWCNGSCIPVEETCEAPQPTCPEACPLGTECTSPAEGCKPIPAPGPVCEGDQNCGCWHWPPDSRTWLYACCAPWVTGGVVNVVAGPAQCPRPPEPTCPEQCPVGQTCTNPEVGCVPVAPACPEMCPPGQKCTDPAKGCQPTTTPGSCPYPTPTAAEAAAQGKNPGFNVHKQNKQLSGTPVADFGAAYYCAIGWTEACNEGRRRGPVAPDGDPNRLPCEQHFLEAPCPIWTMAKCLSSAPGACPITFDPYIVINGVNQNHPSNVAAGCVESEWVKEDGKVVKGGFWWSTGHGNGVVEACDKNHVACGTAEINQ